VIPEEACKELGIGENSVLELEVYAGDKILLTVLVK
jgi:bifunctional DNA-binding transcriptional regulator/antitoxin component of YhaV-PrlF toxin-antitoxin module